MRDRGVKNEGTAAQALSPAGTGRAAVFQLEVVLVDTKPPVWRRLQVPGNANLGWLHAVLQVAMGWTNSHLHHLKKLKWPRVTEEQLRKVLMGRDGYRE